MTSFAGSDELRQKAQDSLIEFLEGELGLAATMAHSSQLATEQNHTEHAAQAKRSAVKAVQSIRRFLEKITDGNARRRIEEQLPALDRLIASL